MSDENAPAGWYPAEAGSERYWNGTAWTEEVRPTAETPTTPDEDPAGTAPGSAEAPGSTTASVTPQQGIAIAALVVGIVAFVLGLIPFIGIIIGLVGAALGIVALARRRAKPLSIIGVVLSVIALAASTTTSVLAVDFAATKLPTIAQELKASASPHPTPTPLTTTKETPGTSKTDTVARQTWSGASDKSVQLTLTIPAYLRFECPNCTGTTAVITDTEDGKIIDTSGPYTGGILVNSYGETLHSLRVTATGNWTMTVEDIAAAPGFDAEAAGNGDEVFWLDASSSSAAITHEGSGHFSVEVFDKSGATTVIDTSGAVDKTLPFSAPAYVQVRSEGSWAITLKSQTDAGSS